MRLRNVLISGIVLVSMVSAAHAAKFDLDPNYTSIGFRIKHLMGYTTGIFEKYDGVIELNRDNTGLVRLEGTILADSINTRLAERDKDLRSERFFYVKEFPEITFKSTKIENGKATGDLTIRGVTKRVTFDYEFWGTAKDQRGKLKTAVSLKGTVNRRDFGMIFNMTTESGTALLGDDVDFKLELHGMKK